MDHRKRLLARVFSGTEQGGTVDLGELLARLLLFDTYVIDSVHFFEIPRFVAAFGFEGTVHLLESGALQILHHARTIGQTLQPGSHRFGQQDASFCSFSFGRVEAANQRADTSSAMSICNSIPGLSPKQAQVLRSAVGGSLVEPSSTVGESTVSSFVGDLKRAVPAVRFSILDGLRRTADIVAVDEALSLRVEEIGKHRFFVETNLSTHGIPANVERKIVERALLAVAGLNMKIAEMKAYSVVCGLSDEDLPIFEEKIGFLWTNISPDEQRLRFGKVYSLTGLPDLGAASEGGRINIDRLLEIRSTRECLEFREWLRSTDEMSDTEIRERTRSLRARLGVEAQRPLGKAIRLATTSGVGFIPGIGSVLGVAASALDTFVTERVFPYSGPMAFLHRDLPTIFDT